LLHQRSKLQKAQPQTASRKAFLKAKKAIELDDQAESKGPGFGRAIRSEGGFRSDLLINLKTKSAIKIKF